MFKRIIVSLKVFFSNYTCNSPTLLRFLVLNYKKNKFEELKRDLCTLDWNVILSELGTNSTTDNLIALLDNNDSHYVKLIRSGNQILLVKGPLNIAEIVLTLP